MVLLHVLLSEAKTVTCSLIRMCVLLKFGDGASKRVSVSK